MTASTPARDFLLPRLNALLDDARGHGISRDVGVAVLIDLVTGPGFNDTPLDATEDAPATNTGSAPFEVGEMAVAEAEAIPLNQGGALNRGQGRIGRLGDTSFP